MSTVSKLQIVLEATTTAFDNGLKKATASLQGFAKKTDEIHSKMDKFARKNKDALNALQTAGAAATVGLGAMAVGIKGAVTAAVDFEKSMAGVKKVVDFETPEQFKQMEQDIIALSQRLPMAATDIATIMEAAGQSGIAREELSRFAESAIKMGVAFDITAEEAGKAMAEMRAAFGMSQTEVETLADQINYLGNNSTNSAPQIMEVVQRIGSLAESANISSSTLAALTASMVGVAPEVAATSLKNFSLQLVKGESLSKSAKAAFETMGLDYNQVAKDMQTDSEATIRKVLEAAQKVPEHMRAAVLNDAFGSESIAAISQLVNNYESVDKNLKAMGDSATYAGSMLKEFEGMAGTSAAQMQLFDNNIQAVKIAFGSAFLPVLNQTMEAITPVLKSITDWAQQNPELVRTIASITAGVLGAIAVLGGLALAFTAVTSGIGALLAIGSMIGGFFSVISSGVGIVSMFGGALAALGFPVTAVVAGIAALVAAGVALYMNWDTLKAKAIEVWNAIPEYANQAWQWIQGVWNGVGAWFSGIWDSVSASVSGAIDGVINSVTGVVSSISTAFSNFSFEAFFSGVIAEIEHAILVALPAMWDNATQYILGLFAGMPAPVQEMVANILSIVGYGIDGLGAVFQGFVFVASAVWNGITAAAKVAVDVISSIWQTLTSVANSAWSGITAVAKSVFGAVVAVWQSLSSAVSSAWQSIVDVAKSVWDSVKTAVQSAINAIKPIITSVTSFFASTWDGLVSIAQGVWNAIKATVSAGINGAKAVLTAGVTGFAIIFNAGFNAAKTVVSTVLNAIKALVRGDINGVKTAIQNGMSQLGGIARNAMGQMLSAVLSIGARLRQAGGEIVQGLINGISDKIESAVAKVREMASRMKNAVTGFFDIRSPSRVMKQIGEWVSEGLAIGIAYKAPMAAEEAKKMAENAKKAVESEMDSVSRSIFTLKQKVAGNPFAELTTDIAFGKYQGQDTTRLLALKEEERLFSNVLSMTDSLRKIKQDIALLGKTNLEIMEWEYEHTDKYLGINREIFDDYKKANDEFERRNKLLADSNDLAKKQQDLQKRIALFGSTDPLAEIKYDLQSSTADQAQKDVYLSDLARQNAKESFFGLQNSYNIETPAQKLEREYQEKLAVITNYEQQIGDVVGAAVALRTQVESEHARKVVELEAQAYTERLNSLQSGINLASGVWDKMTEIVKNSYGEQSTAAKIMFAGQRVIAISQAIINTELAATKALAEGGMIMGVPAANVVRATGYASVGLIAGQAISGLTGQAHNGISHVPREGTWLLDKGERVVKPQDNDRLTKFLDNPNHFVRSEPKVIINNYTSEKADVQQMPNGDTMVIIGRMMKQVGRAEAQQVLREELGQNGLISRRLK